MATTLTFRTDERLRSALESRALAEGKTVSEVVRELLREALAERDLFSRAGHLKGKLELPDEDHDPWRRHLRESNWR
jgi:hypothetical protein